MNKKKILIAEDNLSNFKYLYYVLVKDYEIIHAQNGEEAIELFKEKQPDLILMDIGMPIMDGIEATREIRKLSADIPIVGLTAYAYASDETKGLESDSKGGEAKRRSLRLKKVIR